jgi:hypothetical protein
VGQFHAGKLPQEEAVLHRSVCGGQISTGFIGKFIDGFIFFSS